MLQTSGVILSVVLVTMFCRLHKDLTAVEKKRGIQKWQPGDAAYEAVQKTAQCARQKGHFTNIAESGTSVYDLSVQEVSR